MYSIQDFLFAFLLYKRHYSFIHFMCLYSKYTKTVAYSEWWLNHSLHRIQNVIKVRKITAVLHSAPCAIHRDRVFSSRYCQKCQRFKARNKISFKYFRKFSFFFSKLPVSVAKKRDREYLAVLQLYGRKKQRNFKVEIG